FQDYVYGSAPVVYVRIELEHCILRDSLKIGDKKYIDLMPAAIKAGSYVFKESARPTSPSSDRRRSSY
ncbi:MAG: hypothetical protein FWC56_00980, partial [Phycisphaerae bacterium]|nr:hypothetical protein [Phycisphaerae bacterium]